MSLRKTFLFLLLAAGPCLASSDSVVVFNEVMYHPSSSQPGEWIELHNQMSVDIDLSRWRIEGGVRFAFPEGTIIPGRGYLVVAGSGSGIPGALEPLVGRLDNGGDSLRLLSASDRLMNEVVYNDRGEWPIAPDGTGVTLAKLKRDAAASVASHWTWSAQIGGTPGAINFEDDAITSRDLRINEITPAGAEDFWIELHNRGASAINVEGLVLSRIGTDDEIVLGALAIAPGGYLVVDQEELMLTPDSGDIVALYNAERNMVLDAVTVRERARARVPDGSDAMVIPSELTPGEGNVVDLVSDIVINEIFYSHPPQYRTEVVPFAEMDEEWIELFNRGGDTVDLSGWRLQGDLDYSFPEGTTIAPGGFVVIANDALGFRGSLSNSSGYIVLEDLHGNVADDVRYHDNGYWPTEADAGGSSLELRDPDADNSQGGAWAASDEVARTAWQEISYRGVAAASAVGPDNQWRELVIGMLGRGEVLIDDIRVTSDPDGTKGQLISNSTFQPSIFGGSTLRGWRPRGNHRHSEVVPDPDDPKNFVLRIVATGKTEHMHNHIETSFSGGARVNNGETYEISFRARPVSGSPQLHTRLYFNRLAKVHVLTRPDEIGTPGLPNSRLEANLGPTLSELSHHPAVPSQDEPCRVHVRANDPNGVESLTLRWSVDGAPFGEVPMARDEGDGFAATIPAQPSNAIVHFYVEATDSDGASSLMPPGGEQSRALYQVGDASRLGVDGLNHFRIILTQEDEDWMHEPINLMSNDRVPATVIYREREIFYDVGVRLKGSERGRVTTQRLGFNVMFPNQQRFRGVHRTVAIDRSEGVGFGQFEMLFNQIMTHSGGIPAEYNDLIHVITPREVHTGAAELQLARYGDIFLDSQFENGADGILYDYELIYFPTSDDADGYKLPSPDTVVGTNVRDLGEELENYRWNFLLKNEEDRDDFRPIRAYAQLFSMNNEDFQANVSSILDVDRWLQGMAFALLSGAGDQYAANSQHNGMFYQQPNGKFIFFPHDLDFAFDASRSITQNSDLQKILQNPAHERLYLAHVQNILKTSFNEAYIRRWAAHFGALLPGQNFDGHFAYISSRARSATTQLNRMAPKATFEITTNDGQDFELADRVAEIDGLGGLSLYRLEHIETGKSYAPEWTGLDSWRIRVPLVPGTNSITLQGRDITGGTGSLFSPVGRDGITITHTGEVSPATAENLVISEIHYAPASSTVAGFEDASDFEFIELWNRSETIVDLSDVAFTQGVSVSLSGQLSPDERAVVVRRAEAFRARYGEAVRIIAAWGDSKLSNEGERLTLERTSGEVLLSVRYDNDLPWPSVAGASLVLTGGDLADAANWRSGVEGGTPGQAEIDQVPSKGVSEIELTLPEPGLLRLTYIRLIDPDLSYTIETSNDLQQWVSLPGVTVTTTSIDASSERAQVELGNLATIPYRFVRVATQSGQ